MNKRMEDKSDASSTPKSVEIELDTQQEQAKGVAFLDNDEEISATLTESDEISETRSTTDNKTDPEETSAVLDLKGSRDYYPKIVQNFRPEPRSVGEISSRSVPSFGIDKPKMEKKIGFDGREITLVTLVTQTDWDWVEEALVKMDEDDKVDEGKLNGNNTDTVLPNGSKSNNSGRELTSRGKTDGTLTSLDTTSIKSPFSMPPNDEFGIPLLDMSSSDDDSCSDDDLPKPNTDDQVLLPSIGPPEILKYKPEVDEAEKPLNEEDDEYDTGSKFDVGEHGQPIGIFGGFCEFCEKEIKPFPTIEQQQELPPEELYCCGQYREFVQFATSTAMELEEETMKTKHLINIKPHGHFGSKKARKAAKERAVQRMRDRELEKRKHEAFGVQSYYAGASNNEPGSHVDMTGGGRAGGTKTRDPRNAGPTPLSYKDMANHPHHQQHQHQQGQQHQQLPPATAASINTRIAATIHPIEVARQMKTINYQLSSQKCLEEGWTVRPPTPVEEEDDMTDVFLPEPLDFNITAKRLKEREVMKKDYENGKTFLMIFPDGTGSVFYPSGELAVSICKMDVRQYIYVVHDYNDNNSIMGVFEPNGHGCCYHKNGNVRLYFDQLDGIELDQNGRRKKKWSWKDQETHIHAPPFQPICIGLNKFIGLRVMSQEHITVTFMSKNRSCRFNVGARLKLMKPESIKPKEVSDNMIFMEEKAVQIESILHKVSNVLRFPHSPKVDKILPPLRVTHKMQRVEQLRSRQKNRRESILSTRIRPVDADQSSSNRSLPSVVVN